MGNRLSKIYTRTGDDGTTGLADGERVPKTSARIEAMGAIDELNSVIGLLVSESESQPLLTLLSNIQHSLFDLGGELSLPNEQLLSGKTVDKIEQSLDSMNEMLPPLKEFVLPGGSRAAALCHQARSVCRRAERRMLSLGMQEEISQESSKYLNRLSDLLFVMARMLNQQSNKPDVFWKKSFDPK